jgi:hypothetical protein
MTDGTTHTQTGMCPWHCCHMIILHICTDAITTDIYIGTLTAGRHACTLMVSICKHVSTFASKFHFYRGHPLSKNAIQHISSVPWPHSPSRSPMLPSPDICPPSSLGHHASSISVLEIQQQAMYDGHTLLLYSPSSYDDAGYS